jgi:hypothetical protein
MKDAMSVSQLHRLTSPKKGYSSLLTAKEFKSEALHRKGVMVIPLSLFSILLHV